MSSTVTRVTHSCALLDFGGERVLTDPWFSEKPGYRRGEPLAFSPSSLPTLSAVVASHAHYDHYDLDAFATYPDKEVSFVVGQGMAAAAHKAGFVNVTEMEPWQQTTVGTVRITATPAKHGVPENTFVIEAAGVTVFFGADTLRIPELDQIADRWPRLDLAMLPINGLRIRPAFNRQVVMNAEQAGELCRVLKPRLAVPIHYAFTAGWLRDRLLLKYDGTPERFRQAVAARAPTTTVEVLAPGKRLSLDNDTGNDPRRADSTDAPS